MMKDNVIDIEKGMECEVGELLCVGCLDRYFATWPSSTYLKDLECRKCAKKGLIIITGERLIGG